MDKNHFEKQWIRQCEDRRKSEDDTLVVDMTGGGLVKEKPSSLPPLKLYKVIKTRGGVDKLVSWRLPYTEAEMMLKNLEDKIKRKTEEYPGYHENHELIEYRLEEDSI